MSSQLSTGMLQRLLVFAACAFFRYYANICKLLMIVRVAEIKL